MIEYSYEINTDKDGKYVLCVECPECKSLLKHRVIMHADTVRGHWQESFFECINNECKATYKYEIQLHRILRNIKIEYNIDAPQLCKKGTP